MAKVLGVNVILCGKEYKAGTKESDLPGDVKKSAAQFLIDEKKFQPKGKPDEAPEVKKLIARIFELEEEVDVKGTRAHDAETALSEANSTIAGLESQLENEKSRADDVEAADKRLEESINKLTEAEEKLAIAEAKVAEMDKAPQANKK